MAIIVTVKLKFKSHAAPEYFIEKFSPFVQQLTCLKTVHITFAGSSIFLFCYGKFSDAYSSDFLLVIFWELFAGSVLLFELFSSLWLTFEILCMLRPKCSVLIIL